MVFDNPTQNMPGGPDEVSSLTRNSAAKFPNPFMDMASEYIPRDLRQIFSMVEFMYLTEGTVRQASRRVIRYFLTEVILDGGSEDERDEYLDLLNKQLHILTELANVGDEYMCFHGDTKVVLKDGIYPIRALSGKRVEVLSQGGIYRTAEFKSFGKQRLLEVEFADGRTVLATPEHQWIVSKSTGGTVKVPTTKLAGRRIERTVAARPPQGPEFREGVRHGFVYGDGTTYNKHRKITYARAYFYGAKDEAVMPFFEGHGTQPLVDKKRRRTIIGHLPLHYKTTLPARDASAEYWYGFICGFLAADGSVDTYGCTILTQASTTVLKAIEEQLPRIGMVAGPIRGQLHESDFTREDGSKYTSTGMGYFMTLLKQFMRVEDLIITSHQAKFLACDKPTNYGKLIGVKAVRETGLIDEVFCCVEPETHSFVIDNGILTGNCYGNSFVSIYFPFDRFLICPECGTNYHIDTIDYQFRPRSLSFECTCKRKECGYKGEFDRQDRKSSDKSRIKLRRWNPKLMQLRWHDISGDIKYYMELDMWFVDKIRKGNRFFINDTPWEIIECCCGKYTDLVPLFKFHKDTIYHLHDATLMGLNMRGWGMPPLMTNFKLAYYIKVLRRYDEAIAMDFIMPFRVIFPKMPASANGMDALSTTSMAVFNAHIKRMISDHRKEMTDVQSAPYEIGYQMIGGEGKALAPKENIALALDELLNAMGFPAELYKGTLQMQAFPVALRMFEKTWGNLVDGYNDMLAWIIKSVSRQYSWGDITGSLRSVTLADDIERKALSLQAAAGQDISKQTAYKNFEIDYLSEQAKVVEEQKEIMKLQQEAQAEQASAQYGGGDQQAGGGGTSSGGTPGDLTQQAKDLAQQLLLQVPDGQRRAELAKIKSANPTLYSLVVTNLAELRRTFASQGKTMMIEQAKQQGQGQPGTKAAEAPPEANYMPGALGLSALIAQEVLSCDVAFMRKLALEVATGVPGAREGFSFFHRYRTYGDN